jgi:hypothetical protein
MESSGMRSSGYKFSTPARILIPKLAKSRDDWKTKATARKGQYHKERIRSRDLTISRDLWKERAVAAEQKVKELQSRLERAEADLAQTQSALAQLQEDSKKN